CARHRGRVVAVVDVDQLLRAEERDALLDLDVPVVDRQVHPVGRVPDHAERVLGRLFRTQALGLLAEGVDLDAAGRVTRGGAAVALEGTGGRIDDRVGRERRFLGDDVEGRGDEALAHRTTQGQAVDRVPAQRDLRGEVVAVVRVLLVAAGDVGFQRAGERQ